MVSPGDQPIVPPTPQPAVPQPTSPATPGPAPVGVLSADPALPVAPPVSAEPASVPAPAPSPAVPTSPVESSPATWDLAQTKSAIASAQTPPPMVPIAQPPRAPQVPPPLAGAPSLHPGKPFPTKLVSVVLSIVVIIGVVFVLATRRTQAIEGITRDETLDLGEAQNAVAMNGKCIEKYQFLAGGRDENGGPSYALSLFLEEDPVDDGQLAEILSKDTCIAEIDAASKELYQRSDVQALEPGPLQTSYVNQSGERMFFE